MQAPVHDAGQHFSTQIFLVICGRSSCSIEAIRLTSHSLCIHRFNQGKTIYINHNSYQFRKVWCEFISEMTNFAVGQLGTVYEVCQHTRKLHWPTADQQACFRFLANAMTTAHTYQIHYIYTFMATAQINSIL